MLRLAWVLVVLLGAPAVSLAFDDPDTEVARRHFEKGRAFYDAKDYHAALDEFLAARRAKAASALDYNIARCYDRLEDYPSAAKYYQMYLDGKPNAADVAEVQERVATLKQRIAETPVAPVNPPPRPPHEGDTLLLPTTPPSAPNPLVDPAADARARRRRTGAIVGGVVGGAALIAGAIVLGLLIHPTTPSPTKSDLGPFTVTK